MLNSYFFTCNISKNQRVAFQFVALAALLSLSTCYASSDLRTIALSGDMVTGSTSPMVYSGFGNLSLNERGQVAYGASLADGSSGIFYSRSSSTYVAALRDDLVPNSSNLFRSFSSPHINDSGEVAFTASQVVDGFEQPRSVVAVADSHGISVLARGGVQAPDEITGVGMSVFRHLRFNNLGQAVFSAVLSGPSIDANSNVGLYAHQGGLRRVVREGAPPSSDTEGVGNFFGFNDVYIATLSDSGAIAFFASFEVLPEAVPSSGVAVFRDIAGDLDVLARRMSRPPETPAGSRFIFFTPPSINSAGEVTFDSVVATTSTAAGSGIYTTLEDIGLQATARRNDPLTVNGIEFELDSFFEFEASNESVLINKNSVTAFVANFSADTLSGPINRQGVFSADTNGLSLVAQTGDPAPGFAAGTTFSNFANGSNGLIISINGRDQIAFIARVEDMNGDENVGLFAQDQQGVVQSILAPGDILDVSDDPSTTDIREVASFTFNTSAGDSDGRRNAFNDRGQVAFTAQFTDGSRGVFVSNKVALPFEPGDFNTDNYIDGADFLAWQRGHSPNAMSTSDLVDWQNNFGQWGSLSAVHAVPEPSSLVLVIVYCACHLLRIFREW